MKYNASNRNSTENDPFPKLEGFAVYRLVEAVKGKMPGKPKVREWAILNGMNAGRWTSFFGPYCIADTFDCKSIAEAMIDQCKEAKVVQYQISQKVN